MKEDKNGWIDPAIARRLMLEYRQAIGVKGASEIAKRIKKYTKEQYEPERKTIENWLRSPDNKTSHLTLTMVLAFLRTAHFQEIVPRTRDYLDSNARLSRIGAALFDLYGALNMDAVSLAETNASIAGWWIKCINLQDLKPGYLNIAPVTNHPFSKIHALIGHDEVLNGSGIIFPSGPGGNGFSTRLWSKEDFCRESDFYMSLSSRSGTMQPQLSWRDLILEAGFLPGNQVSQKYSKKFIGMKFERADEYSIPIEIQDLFHDWDQDVIPKNMERHGIPFAKF